MKMSEFIDLMKTAAEPYGEVVVDEVVRASARYVGMYVKKDGVPTPIANLDMLYERYLETDDIDECTEYVTTLFTMKFDSPINIAALATLMCLLLKTLGLTFFTIIILKIIDFKIVSL